MPCAVRPEPVVNKTTCASWKDTYLRTLQHSHRLLQPETPQLIKFGLRSKTEANDDQWEDGCPQSRLSNETLRFPGD